MSQSTFSELANVEVTHDEFRLVAHESEPAQLRIGKPFRLSNILSPKNLRPRRSPQRRATDISVRSDVAISQSNDAQDAMQSDIFSVANFTVGSHDTVKASNRKTLEDEPAYSEPTKKGKRTWTKFKRLIGVKQESAKSDGEEDEEPRSAFGRNRTHSAGHVTSNRANPGSYSLENRTGSDPRHEKAMNKESPARTVTSAEQAHLDQAIRGRLDGMDAISLGSARQVSTSPDPIPPPPNDDDILMQPFTGVSNKYSPRQMVFDMIWTSGGKSPPEFVFEGFLPGGEDRWKVMVEAQRSAFFTQNGEKSSLAKTKQVDAPASSSDDGSSFIPLDKLWRNMWGSDQPPPPTTHMSPTSEKEDILQLASACSVPIDLDEDTFIIETALHLQAVHDIAALSIRCGRLEEALNIFNKVLRGLESRHKAKPHHLVGSTLHNIGLVRLYQGSFGQSFLAFQRAVTVRKSVLPPDHPDISVSLVREGMSLFALERYDDALNSFETALFGLRQENATKAKVLNNIGVVQYKRQDFIEALKAFTAALAIQRYWLDGPVRRESIVYDASITLGNMGKLYLERFDYEMSFYVYEESLLLQATVFPKDHEIVLASLGNLAFAKAKNAEFKKALQIYNSIQRSQTTKYGPESCEVIETTGLMGILHWRHYDHDEALKCLTSVLTWQKSHLKASNPALRRTKDLIRKVVEAVQGEVSVWI